MNTTLAERIQQIIDSGRTQVELAQAAGVTKGTVNQWVDGKIKSIKLEYAQGIEVVTGFDAEWLVTGKGSPKREKSDANVVAVAGLRPVDIGTDENLTGIRKINLRAAAGLENYAYDQTAEEMETVYLDSNQLAKLGIDPRTLLALDVKGASMEPTFYEGDTLLINTADKRLQSGEVYVFNYNGQASVKRLVKKLNEWWLVSDNDDKNAFPDALCRNAQTIVIGKFVLKQTSRADAQASQQRVRSQNASIQEVIDMMLNTDDEGKLRAKFAVKDALANYESVKSKDALASNANALMSNPEFASQLQLLVDMFQSQKGKALPF